MTINADGSMTMVARDIESSAMMFKSYDLTWVFSAETDSLKVISPSGGSETWRIDQLDGNTLGYVVDKPFESHIGSGILTYTYTYHVDRQSTSSFLWRGGVLFSTICKISPPFASTIYRTKKKHLCKKQN